MYVHTLPVELRCVVYKMYLDSEITHHDQIIDENDPKASWPDIHICCSTLSGQYIRSRDDVHVVPMLAAFAPRIFGTSHTMREEIIDVFLTGARITIHSGLPNPVTLSCRFSAQVRHSSRLRAGTQPQVQRLSPQTVRSTDDGPYTPLQEPALSGDTPSRRLAYRLGPLRRSVGQPEP
jgi:hypothetical protein